MAEQTYVSLDGVEVTLTYPDGWTPPMSLGLGPPGDDEVWPHFGKPEDMVPVPPPVME